MSFKLGDYIIFDNTQPYCRLLPSELRQYVTVSPSCDDNCIIIYGDKLYEVGKLMIRPATPKEIEQGFRDE